MTDINTRDLFYAALASAGLALGCRADFYKASFTAVAASYYSGWTATGSPGAGSAPAASWASPTYATSGALNPRYLNRSTQTNRLLEFELTQANAGATTHLCDRVGHIGTLSGAVATAQTVNGTLTAPAADGRCNADGSDVMWFLEWYAATGSTAVTATVNVTYNDDTTGNVTISLAATRPIGFMARILPAVAGKWIKGVNTVTLSATTGAAGNFGVTAYKRLCSSAVPAANWTDKNDFAYCAMPVVGNNACLSLIHWCTTTSIGVQIGAVVVGGA